PKTLAPSSASPAANSSSGVAQEREKFTPADAAGRYVHLIEFADLGLMRREEAKTPGAQFNVKSAAAQADMEQMKLEQAAHVERIASTLGRQPDVTHHYLVTHSGIATRLTLEEAQAIRNLPGIASVEREREYVHDTYRSPIFIGADKIWDGTAVSGGVGSRGQGIVIAELDTGLDPSLPAYANQAA